MLLIYYPILLLFSQLTTTTGTVYTVVPDDYYYPNTTCHHCHNLQHYLLNATKYFTSNTQLLFLPGLHHLHTDLIIQNIHNFSLIGNDTTIGTSTIIQCRHDYFRIEFVQITHLTISNLMIQRSLNQFVLQHGGMESASVMIRECSSVSMHRVHIQKISKYFPSYSLIVINIVGVSHFVHLTCYGILLYTYETNPWESARSQNITNTATISIDNYIPFVNDSCDRISLLNLYMNKKSYGIMLKLSNMIIKEIISQSQMLHFKINTAALVWAQFFKCEFVGCHSKAVFDFNFSYLSYKTTILFADCLFINNKASNGTLIRSNAEIKDDTNQVWLNISNSVFLSNEINNVLIS